MKTKFEQLVYLRKEALKEGERKIMAVNQKIQGAQSSLDQAQQRLYEIVIPKKGESYNELLRFQSLKESHLYEIEQITVLIAALKLERKSIQEEVRYLNIEYEKAKYLDSLEKQKIINEVKRKETQYLDEVSIMLYNAKQEGECS